MLEYPIQQRVQKSLLLKILSNTSPNSAYEVQEIAQLIFQWLCYFISTKFWSFLFGGKMIKYLYYASSNI